MDESDRLRAVSAAYDAHVDDVYRVAYAILHDPDDAIDVTQDVFVRAFEQWHRYDPQRPLRPWLHAIAGRTALDRLRRRRVRYLALPALARADQTRLGNEYAGSDPASTVPPREAIRQALTELAPTARAAVLLRHRYGYDYSEIAEFLSISVSSIGAILSRARAQMRAQLSDEAPSTLWHEEQI